MTYRHMRHTSPLCCFPEAAYVFNVRMLLSAADPARTLGLFFNRDLNSILRQDFLNEFRPFEKAETTAVKVVLITHIIDLFQLLDTVEVEVVDGIALSVGVFIDEGESG